jgi:hypothetical protein
MTDQTVIRLHNSKDTEFEFDVAIQGPSQESSPIVRFVVEDVRGYNVAIDCESAGNDKWAVRIPALQNLNENHNFHVEVIVDGYFFVPTNGIVEVINPPQVAMRENIATKKIEKPLVSAKFENTVKVTAKKQLIEYRDMDVDTQAKLHQQTVAAGAVLAKAGKIMENGFEAKGGRRLDTTTLNKLVTMVKESLDSVTNKIFLG